MDTLLTTKLQFVMQFVTTQHYIIILMTTTIKITKPKNFNIFTTSSILFSIIARCSSIFLKCNPMFFASSTQLKCPQHGFLWPLYAACLQKSNPYLVLAYTVMSELINHVCRAPQFQPHLDMNLE